MFVVGPVLNGKLLHLVGDLFELYDEVRTYKTLNLKSSNILEKLLHLVC